MLITLTSVVSLFADSYMYERDKVTGKISNDTTIENENNESMINYAKKLGKKLAGNKFDLVIRGTDTLEIIEIKPWEGDTIVVILTSNEE
jgi:hypothetical protein